MEKYLSTLFFCNIRPVTIFIALPPSSSNFIMTEKKETKRSNGRDKKKGYMSKEIKIFREKISFSRIKIR